ncbi:MAG: Holliday junction resolvase RuvX [Microbacteriaceae bacterium]|nr:MAG: Holliday junction resolvase RuvX [Microbacteriaceae bacterium]
MRQGARVGIDVGRVRIGVSRSDLHGMLAVPVETVKRAHDGSDFARVRAIAAECDAIEIVVGLPLSLSGSHTASTEDAVAFARGLAESVRVPVRLVDERLSTVSAQSALRASGRNTKSSRSVIDQAAATVILEQALEMERVSGRLPGTLVIPTIGPTS